MNEDTYTCDECGGTGVIITCCDDICVGQGYCMHGDGESICPKCDGDGEIHYRGEEDTQVSEDMPVNVTSGFGAQKRVPFVELQIGEFSIQLEPESARNIAFMLLEAAEAADTDAMVMRVLGSEDESTAIQLLRLFRQYRVESRQEKDHAD